MANNTTLPAGSGGDTIRNIDKAGVKTQVVTLDLGGAGAETLLSGTVPVSGTVATGGLTDAQLRLSAVPVSLASTTITGTVALTANQSVNNAQINGVAPLMGNGVTGTGSQRVTISSDNTAFAVNATLTAETTKVIGTVNVAAAQTIAVTQATSANLNVTATPIALTKATQGATGYTTQDLKDAGRSSRTITLDSFAVAAVTETLNTMSFSTDNGTATTGTSYTVTAAKRFRMQAITLSLHSITGNTTAVAVIVRLRINNGGAAVVTSPLQFIGIIPGVATGNMGSTTVNVAIPDGYEIVAGAGIGVTTTCAGFVATTAAPKVDIAIMGYEY